MARLRAPQPLLTEWLSATGTISHEDQYLIDKVLFKLIDNADSWNEEELKMNFISLIIFSADFNEPIRTYYDREIAVDIQNVFLYCKADMMLSKGVLVNSSKRLIFFSMNIKGRKNIRATPSVKCSGVCSLVKQKITIKTPFMVVTCKGVSGFFLF